MCEIGIFIYDEITDVSIATETDNMRADILKYLMLHFP